MQILRDAVNRSVRFSDERQLHIETDHPEMAGQMDRVADTLTRPDLISRSRTDPAVELFYRFYASTPVSAKYLCVVVKCQLVDSFLITAYYTDSVKKGEVLWKKQ